MNLRYEFLDVFFFGGLKHLFVKDTFGYFFELIDQSSLFLILLMDDLNGFL